MPESFINKKTKFKTIAEQRVWMSKIKSILTVRKMAVLCGYSERTVRHWIVGGSMVPYQSILLLAKTTKVPLPSVTLVDRYEHTKLAGKIGGRAVVKKYGRVPVDDKVRKEKWLKWWEKTGQYTIPRQKSKSVILPPKDDRLAEFVGIMLGDGGMSQYQLSVTLHSVDDYQYGLYVQKLISELFGVKPGVYMRKDVQAYNIAFARKEAVQYFCSLGLVIGNKVKQSIKIPDWILKNESYSLACLRGLMDTDGSVYMHQYNVNGKKYQYKKLCFSSASDLLRKDVQFILHRFGSAATCSGTNVRIDSIGDVKRYMEVIGTHNPKHLIRYNK